METLASFFMLAFGLGFFIFSCSLARSWNVADNARIDHRNDLEYNRSLNEKREFGFKQVEDAIKSRPFLRKYKFK